jgi:putative FmdB family regulatory protein
VESRPAAEYRERSWPASQCPSVRNRPKLRLPDRVGWSSRRTTINPVPIYEFACQSCDHRFEELVGSQVGLDVSDVVCPECGSAKVERRVSTSYAPLQHQMTPNQRRRLEDKRGTNRDGAKERFKQQRAAEKRAAARRGGGGS